MRRIVLSLMTLSLVAAYSAFAQDDSTVSTNTSNDQAGVAASDQTTVIPDQNTQTTVTNSQPGYTEDAAVSTAEAPAPEKKRGLVDEKVGIKPQVGDLNYRDASGGRANRALYGFTMDFNAGDALNQITGMKNTGLFFGPSLGFFFSHIGAVGGNFFGSNGAPGTNGAFADNSDPGANLFMLPADLKLGWTVFGARLSVHGGGNVLYRSNAAAVQAGVNTPTYSGSKWGILPNAGADLEYGVVNGAALIIRPDWTFGGSNELFTGTVGLSIPIG